MIQLSLYTIARFIIPYCYSVYCTLNDGRELLNVLYLNKSRTWRRFRKRLQIPMTEGLTD